MDVTLLPLEFHSLREDPLKNLLSRAFISKEFGGLPNEFFFLSSLLRGKQNRASQHQSDLFTNDPPTLIFFVVI